MTYAYANGIEVGHIAEVSGHSKSECKAIIREHYLAGEGVIGAIPTRTKTWRIVK